MPLSSKSLPKSTDQLLISKPRCKPELLLPESLPPTLNLRRCASDARPDPRSDVFGKAEQWLGKQHMSLRSACTGCYQVEKGFWALVKRLHPLIGWLQGACMCSTVFVGVSHLPLLKVAGEKLAGYLAEDSP